MLRERATQGPADAPLRNRPALHMDLRRLRYFCAVAEELHFGRAAERMHVVQSAISHQMKLLEQELGLPLLERSRRGVGLTVQGKIFLPEAHAILARLETGIQRARAVADGAAGALSVSFVDNVLWSTLPPILRRFRAHRPNVDLTLRPLDRASQIDALRASTVDLAILPGPEPRRGIDTSFLIGAPLLVAVPEGHPISRVGEIDMAALADEPFVLFPPSMRSRILEIVVGSCAAAGFAPRIVQEAEQLHTLLALVSAGLGVTLVPSWVARAYNDGVAYARVRGPAHSYDLLLAWRSGASNPSIESFRSIAAAVVEEGLAQVTSR
jgi:DNA-binding transcriptional LysR family regulator